MENNHDESVWHFQRQVFNFMLPENMACWLFDPASLTARLIAACDEKFRVRVMSQSWATPLWNEAKRLEMRERQAALIREVFLYCGDQPWVFARTVIPRTTLTGKEKYLANLGSKPLGAVLFADPNMQRDEFEVTCLAKGDLLFQHASQMLLDEPEDIWGRRSVFYLSGKPLLVNEIFLPTIAQCRSARRPSPFLRSS
ncbi:MAG: chorismate lyase [Thioalkalispiraceae bacterium]|jgi:chorismate--pyruvate lyase